jgi:DNA-binding transcriptional LysR family regulator
MEWLRGTSNRGKFSRLNLKPAHIVMASPYFYSALESVLISDLVAVVPERLARSWLSQFGLVVLPIKEKKACDLSID